MHCAELLLFSTNVNQPKVRTKDSMALLAQGLYYLRPASSWRDNRHHQWSYNTPASKPHTASRLRDVSPDTKLLTTFSVLYAAKLKL